MNHSQQPLAPSSVHVRRCALGWGCSVLGHTWLAWQVASGAVLAESAFPLHLVLQFTQGELTNRCGALAAASGAS